MSCVPIKNRDIGFSGDFVTFVAVAGSGGLSWLRATFPRVSLGYSRNMNLIFVIPIFNDWQSFRQLIVNIDKALAGMECRATVLAIDDGSSAELDEPLGFEAPLRRVESVEVVTLACNMGHQKAIAVGLSVASKREAMSAVVVMDGDGEDDPADLPRLLAVVLAGRAPIGMAHRSKRSEGLLFKVLYTVYKFMFRHLTGVRLTFGNYCALHPAAARRLAFMPNLWNSLPATCLRSKLPLAAVPTIRGNRYAGEPKMSFVNLVLHGLQAITVFSDAVLVRLSLLSAAAAAVSLIVVLTVRFSVDWIVPGWASNMMGFLVLSLLMVMFSLLTTSLLTLQERSNMPMIPFLHADQYVEKIRKVLL